MNSPKISGVISKFLLRFTGKERVTLLLGVIRHRGFPVEVLNDPENTEKRRSRESLSVDVVKYESGPDGGEEVSMSVEWNGVFSSGLQSFPASGFFQ